MKPEARLETRISSRSPIAMSCPLPAPMSRYAISVLALTIFLSLLSLDLPARAQAQDDPPSPLFIQPPFVPVRDRITSFIDEGQRVTLRGNRHPLAVARYDAGAVGPDFPMERMILTLLPDAAQQDALNQLLDAQHNPESPYYRQWLTPEQYGERFGISESDAAQVVIWLQRHAMRVQDVTAGPPSIPFLDAASHSQP